MEDIVPILEPLEQITELLGKEDVPTGSQVFILLYSLINNDLKLVDGDSGVVKDLKSKIVEGLQKRFDIDNQGVPNSNCVANSPLLVASVLDPRYKSFIGRVILSEEKTKTLHDRVLGLMGSLAEPASQAHTIKQENEEVETEAPLAKKAKFLDILQGDVIDLTKVELPIES